MVAEEVEVIQEDMEVEGGEVPLIQNSMSARLAASMASC